MNDKLIEKIKPDREAAKEWAHKVSKSKPPRYTDASRNAAAVILADAKIIKAAEELADGIEWEDDGLSGFIPVELYHAYRAAVDEGRG